jgi:murein DD-endopeptidase MepM/ murein hydrolase activator NlpD
MTHCIIVHIYNTVRHKCQRGIRCRLPSFDPAWLSPGFGDRMVSVRKWYIFVMPLLFWLVTVSVSGGQDQPLPVSYLIQPGDTWTALALGYGQNRDTLQAQSGHLNKAREPVIGRTIMLSPDVNRRSGRLIRSNHGGFLQTSVLENQPLWELAVGNQIEHPFRPQLYQPILIQDEDSYPVDLPAGLSSLELSHSSPVAGQVLGVSSQISSPIGEISAELEGFPLVITLAGDRLVGMVGTGAFFNHAQPELTFLVDGQPAWRQPWQFADKEWDFQSLTLTGEAARIDQKARDEERERLTTIWQTVGPDIQWDEPFQLPIKDYLEVSAMYGGRRSYNGGPFATYHEGVDFSAYAGTPVFAPAAGNVVLAEPLYVRGGAVILDHGLGIFTGYYHLSEINVSTGQAVQPGELLGGVGTTGLSTGNHLHWDLLVNGVWVDALDWLNQDMACWIRLGLNLGCGEQEEQAE